MTEKIKYISNPLTIIAIFAALAEINATASIALVDKELQSVFIWFVILFPTLLIILFFLTLNFNTKVIYAPSDYKDDNRFHKMLNGEPKPDKEINNDKQIIRKTLDELGLKKKEIKERVFNVSENVSYLFSVRYTLERALRRLNEKYLDEERPKPIIMIMQRLVEIGIISPIQHKAIRNIYSITTPAIHGDDNRVTIAEIDFVKQIAPGLIDELQKTE